MSCSLLVLLVGIGGLLVGALAGVAAFSLIWINHGPTPVPPPPQDDAPRSTGW